jgi:hypothetical protein
MAYMFGSPYEALGFVRKGSGDGKFKDACDQIERFMRDAQKNYDRSARDMMRQMEALEKENARLRDRLGMLPSGRPAATR